MCSSLDKQHYFFMALLRNQIIHPCIPRDNLVSIADIGTGTGYVDIYTSNSFTLTRKQENTLTSHAESGFRKSRGFFPAHSLISMALISPRISSLLSRDSEFLRTQRSSCMSTMLAKSFRPSTTVVMTWSTFVF